MGSSVLRISLSPAPIQTPDQSSVKAFAPCSTTRSTAGALEAPAATSWRELMRDFDENNITAAVVDRFANTPDPRLKEESYRCVTTVCTMLPPGLPRSR